MDSASQADGEAKVVLIFNANNALDEIELLKQTKANIDANKNIQTFQPTPEDSKMLEDAINEIATWRQNLPKPPTQEQRDDMFIVEEYRKYYTSLSFNCQNSAKISANTKATLSIVMDINQDDLSVNAKDTLNLYLRDMQNLASQQRLGYLPKEEVRTKQTKAQMQKLLGKNVAGDVVGALIFVNSVPTIVVSDKSPDSKGTIIHETQHLIQYSKGKLAYQHGKVLAWTYDIYDEVEAFKMQYLVAPNSMPSPVQSIDDITPAYLQGLYPELPQVPLSVNSTLEEIDNAMVAVGKKKDGPKFILSNTEKNAVPLCIWEDIKSDTLRAFLRAQGGTREAIVKWLNISFKI